MADMLAYVLGRAMGAIMIIISIKGHSTRLQNEIEARDDEPRCGAAGGPALVITKCGKCLQISMTLASVPIR